MELKNILRMTKIDRYTQDGRDELAKLQETEDVTYKIGDISQKTGLQKTANGWVKPKGGQGKQSAKQEEKGAPKQKKENPAEKMKLSEGQQTILQQQKEKAGQPRNPDFDLSKAGYGEKKTWQEKQTEKLQKKMQEKAGAEKNVHGAEIDKIYEKHQKRIKELKQIENDRIYQQTKEDMRNVGKSKPASYKEGTVIENAKDQYKAFLNKQVEYQQAYHDENKEHPKEPTERQNVLASLVKNASDQRQMFQAIDDMNRGTGGWKINKQTANKLKDLQKEQKMLEAKLKKTEANKPTGSKPDAAKEIAEHREAAQYYKRKARSFSETDPSYSTYMKKAEEYENKAKELEESKPAAEQIGPENKRLTWSPNASVSEKLNDIIKLGEGSEDRTTGPGKYISPKVQENYVRKALSKRLGATEESIEDLIDSMDEKAIKNAFNGFMENYSSDSAPRILTGDTKIRVRK